MICNGNPEFDWKWMTWISATICTQLNYSLSCPNNVIHRLSKSCWNIHTTPCCVCQNLRLSLFRCGPRYMPLLFFFSHKTTVKKTSMTDKAHNTRVPKESFWKAPSIFRIIFLRSVSSIIFRLYAKLSINWNFSYGPRNMRLPPYSISPIFFLKKRRQTTQRNEQYDIRQDVPLVVGAPFQGTFCVLVSQGDPRHSNSQQLVP